VIFAFGSLHRGAVAIFPDTRDPAAWPAELAAHRATHIMLRPGAMRRFFDRAGASSVDLSSLEVLAYGAAPLPQAVLDAGRRLTSCHWVQGYGLSETYGPFCWLDEAAHADGRTRRDTYCVGVLDGTVDVALLPIEGAPPALGEVAVRGEQIMDGYYDVSTGHVSAPDAWFRTGDVGQWSADGDLLLKGRIADSVLSENGHRIYPEEVEAVLCSIAGVDEAVLVGLPSSDGIGQTPVACIEGALASGGRDRAAQTVVAAFDNVLSVEKWPAFVYPADQPFPRNANDKISRRAVIAQIDPQALIPIAVSNGSVVPV
jgi:acyl-CoA synthetase (AMP-forming)/AMP-acid ligase II